jgi:cytochrome P450
MPTVSPPDRRRMPTGMPTGMPPGPASLSLWQTLQWITRPYPYLDRCHRRYGDAFTLRFSGWGTMVFVSDPGAVKEVFAAGPEQLHAGAANEIMRPLLGDDSILLLDGARHLQRRRLLQPTVRPKSMIPLAEDIRRMALRASARFPLGEVFALQGPLETIALETVLRVIFGPSGSAQAELFGAVLRSLLGPGSSAVAFLRPLQRDLGRLSPGGWFRAKIDQLDALVARQIASCRQNGADGSTVVGALLAARDEDGEPLTDRELRDQIVTLLVAGQDPTATAMAWAFHWLLATPGILERLRAELAAVDEGAVEPLLALPYLEAVCREALRITPVVESVQRVARVPLALAGYEVPVGAMVAPCPYLVHRRADVYPEPASFRPERFLERTYAAYEFLPFGGGTRKCLGAPLALLEMKIVLATLLQRFDLRRIAPEKLRPARRNVTVAPSDGTRVIAERRS